MLSNVFQRILITFLSFKGSELVVAVFVNLILKELGTVKLIINLTLATLYKLLIDHRLFNRPIAQYWRLTIIRPNFRNNREHEFTRLSVPLQNRIGLAHIRILVQYLLLCYLYIQIYIGVVTHTKCLGRVDVRFDLHEVCGFIDF